METCKCCSATEPASRMDDEGRCRGCHVIADQSRERMKEGRLLYPEIPARIGSGQQISVDPSPTGADAACDACGERLGDKQHPYSSQGREFFVHDRCWNVILTL